MTYTMNINKSAIVASTNAFKIMICGEIELLDESNSAITEKIRARAAIAAIYFTLRKLK
jgi:hypothetical protein